MPSPSAERKATTRRTPDDLPVHSFRTLLNDLATIAKSRIQPKLSDTATFEVVTRPTVLQQKALTLLAVSL